MTTQIWRGDAVAVAQVETLTVGGTIEADDVFVMTVNGKSLAVVAGSTDADDVRDALVEAWNESEWPEFAEVTAEAGGGTGELTLTADVPGRPFTVSVETTEDGGGTADDQTFGRVTTTASSGPKHWDAAGNWSSGSVPANGDDVVLENAEGSILYGLDQSAVTLDSLQVEQSFTGNIGLPRVNQEGASAYFEYRETYLRISATVVQVGRGEGGGSGRVKLDTGNNACTLNVYNTGAPLEPGVEALLWKGNHASNVVNVSRGSVGLAVLAGESGDVSGGLQVGYVTNPASDAQVRCGTGLTLATVTQSGGELVTQSNVTTMNKRQDSGNLQHLAGTMGTLAGDGGTVLYQSTGTLTTANVGRDCVLDFRRDPRSRTVTNCNLQAGAVVHDPVETVTWTNGFVLPSGVGLGDVTLNIGENFTLSKS